MATVYSTSTVRPCDRLSYWRDVATKEIFRHAFTSSAGSTFRARLSMDSIGDLKISSLVCDPCQVDRQGKDIAKDEINDIVLSIQHAGVSRLLHDGRVSVIGAGTMALLDTGRPSTHYFDSPARFTTVSFAREQIERRVRNLSEHTARAISINGPVSGLTAGFLTMLAERAGTIAAPIGQRLSEQVLDLVALAFASELKSDGAGLASARATALSRLKTVIETQLYDFNLKPAAVAAKAGISVRYANVLLAEEGSSVQRYILQRRLERCRQALEDSRQSHRTISEIAFAWGFSDLSHFTRRFRVAYDMSPGDYRRRARELMDLSSAKVAGLG